MQTTIAWWNRVAGWLWQRVSCSSLLVQGLDRFLPGWARRFLASAVHGQYVHPFSLPQRIEQEQPRGLAFVYHMGLGDALFTLLLVQECKKRWPDLPLWAYVSSTLDTVNSPVTAELLALTPYFDHVELYPGRMREVWTHYDSSTVCPPAGFMRLPLLWKAETRARHRTEQLFQLWGFLPPERLEPPLFPPAQRAEAVQKCAETLKTAKKIILLHLDTRSSAYVYPYRADLAELLQNEGWTVVSFTPLEREVPEVLVMDTETLSLADTLSFLTLIQSWNIELHGVCVQSMFWPLLAGLGIQILGLNIVRDVGIHAYWNASVAVLSAWQYRGVRYPFFFYPQAPRRRQLLRSRVSRELSFADYRPDTVSACLMKLGW